VKVEETAVRQAAEDHAQGVVQGDLRRAGGYLSREAQAAAGDVMKRMPSPLSACEIVSVGEQGGTYLVDIRYASDSDEITVRSIWSEREGRPRIVGLEVV
jgi:hypothetical protein